MIEVRLFDDLAAVEADAGGALSRSVQRSLYDRLDWFRGNIAHGIVKTPIIVARARDGDAASWLFLASSGRGRATPLGGWYSLSFAPVHTGEVDSLAIRRRIAAIAGALRPRLGAIALAPVGESARESILGGFADGGWSTRATPSSANWVAHVSDDDFAAYWKRRPSRLRNTFRRKQREAGLDIVILDRFDADAWADYEAVYATSWKPEEGSPSFLRAMAEAEGAAGTLRLGIARREGRAVAAQLWTVEHGLATIHKLAYVEAERACSPGTVLSEAMFRHVIERDRPATIDFGTGDDAYKADWMDEKRALYRIDLYNWRSPIGLAGMARATVAGWRR